MSGELALFWDYKRIWSVNKVSKKRVVVAMSGGVDSSLAAALLLEQGYDVIGVTMQIWSSDKEDEDHGGCCSLSAVDDARRVANTLGIPYYVMNFRELFEHKVIDYFCQEYLQGRTPNPCIACNKYIKFESFLTKARGLGADYMATGHYACIEQDPVSGRFLLKKAVDDTKDQTYALYTFTQEQLAHTLLPLGGFTKVETRARAKELGLTVASKPDSQEICFVSDNNYQNFLEERLGKGYTKPGPFLDTQGKVLGQHAGISHYTIGQRKGLGITFGKPMFVVSIDPERNAVILGEHEEVFGQELICEQVNFISIADLTGPIEVEAKIRYSAKPAEAIIRPVESGQVAVAFKEPQRAITPGQSVVFYQEDVVVGGGIITR